MKAMIIYKGKYGATQQYAEWLGAALQLPAFTPDSFDDDTLGRYDLVIAGGSVYEGKWQLRKWLFQHAYQLKNKKLLLFIVCGTSPDNKDALQEIARQNIPPHMLNECKVYFLHGRMILKQLSWQDRLMLRIGARLTKDPVQRKAMLQDFDDVKKDNMAALVEAVQKVQHENEKR